MEEEKLPIFESYSFWSYDKIKMLWFFDEAEKITSLFGKDADAYKARVFRHEVGPYEAYASALDQESKNKCEQLKKLAEENGIAVKILHPERPKFYV